MTAQTTKPAHSKGLDFERAANIIQNEIRKGTRLGMQD